MRLPCLLLLCLLLGTGMRGQTTITLENGTAVVVSQLREYGDSLRTEKGCFAKRDILHLANGKSTYAYHVISNGLTEVRFKETCRACRLGRTYGAKYVSTLLMATEFEPRPSEALLADPLFAKFLQEELNDRGDKAPKVELLANELSAKLYFNGNMIVKRSGDTLRVEKDFYIKKDTLCWAGGGRMHKDDVLLVIDRHGQRVFREHDSQLVDLDEPMIDGSPCSVAIVLANIYDRLAVDGAKMNGIDQHLIDPSAFGKCYALEQQRLAEKRPANSGNAFQDGPGEYFFTGRGAVAIGQPNQLILRSGDTLFTKKDFYCKDTLLCYYGGTCVWQRDAFLLRTVKGQFYFAYHGRSGKVPLDAPLADMSIASLGRLHAHRLFASCIPWASTDIPDSLRNNPAFLTSYRAEVDNLVAKARAAKDRADTWSVLNGGLSNGPIGAMIAGAIIKPEDRPFWGTPMPE